MRPSIRRPVHAVVVFASSAASILACAVGAQGTGADETESAPELLQSCPAEDPSCTSTQVTCYIDKDGDGIGTGSGKSYSDMCPTGYADKTGDCNDSDPKVSSKITCYQDKDGDGYGNASVPTTVCATSCPSGYASNNLDCSDNNAGVGKAKTACYTDNDQDGKGGSLVYVCGSYCSGTVTSNHDDCGSSSYCFERYGTANFVPQSFTMTFTKSDGTSQTFWGDAASLSNSKALGSVAKDGALQFTASNFSIVYQYDTQVDTTLYKGTVTVITTLSANKDIASKIDPKTGNVSSLSSDIKMNVSIKAGSLDPISCAESSMPINFASSSPYDSVTGTLALKSSAFAVDKVSGDTLCGAVNSVAGLPGSGVVSFSTTATDAFPISSWPKIR